MRNDKLIPGLVLVLIGAAFLLNNFGIIHFHWFNILHLWPIFLVIGGVNLVFANNKSAWATILKISVLVAGFALVLFGDFGNRFKFWPVYHYSYSNNDNDDNDDDDYDSNDNGGSKLTGKGSFNEPYKADIKAARLNISGGATTYNLSDTTNQLFSAITRDDARYDFVQRKDDSVYVLDFKMKNHHGFNFDSDKNRADFRLNPNPEWQIDVETGATDLNFDLSKFKVRELKLHGGAASFNVKLGMPLANTNVDISTGVSSVDITIPQNAACHIETNSGLSDNHFEGFNKLANNDFETPGFDAAKNKIYINIKGALSDFKVKRY